MIWFLLFQLIGFIFTVGCWFVYAKFLHNKIYGDNWFDVITDNIKKFVISVFVVFAIITVLLSKPLWYTAKCSIHGTSMNANTKYSWVMSECLMETKNKSWIPVKITRGVPDGADNNHDGFPD